MRHRVTRGRRVERVPGRVVPVAADRRLDRPAARTRAAADEREIPTLEAPPPDEPLKPAVRLGGPRDDHQPGCVAVEPVDDAGALLLPAGGGIQREQSVDEGARRVPRRRVHDQPSGLVDDEEVLVLVGDPEVHRLGLERAFRQAGRLEGDLLSARQPVALRASRAVHQDRAAAEQPFGDGPRADLGKPGEEAVEPLARRRVRDAQAGRRSRAAGAAARGRRGRA